MLYLIVLLMLALSASPMPLANPHSPSLSNNFEPRALACPDHQAPNPDGHTCPKKIRTNCLFWNVWCTEEYPGKTLTPNPNQNNPQANPQGGNPQGGNPQGGNPRPGASSGFGGGRPGFNEDNTEFRYIRPGAGTAGRVAGNIGSTVAETAEFLIPIAKVKRSFFG